MSFFDKFTQLPPDPVLGVAQAFDQDPRSVKVNLSVGFYKDADNHPYVLEVVRDVEKRIYESNGSKNYQPIEGSAEFIKGSINLVFGKLDKAIYGIQAVGGTGALRIGAELLAKNSSGIIALSDPTWPNHPQTFERGGLKCVYYPYYDPKGHTLRFEEMCKALQALPPRSAVLLQPCCHNPTGIDPTFEQWQQLEVLIKKYNLIPFFDLADQGFGEGVEEDAHVVRYFVERGHEVMLATTNSKNFGIYGERAGFFAVHTQSATQLPSLASHIKQIIRGSYSSPPLHAGLIVSTILNDAHLKERWMHEVGNLRMRIQEMRKAFAYGLLAKDSAFDFSFLLKQNGIFSYGGLNPQQVKRLREDWGVYLLESGRINVAGINPHNMEYLIEAFLAVV